MGTIKQGILGGFSGKVAGVVGSSWKGIAVMKSLPLSVANPKTAGQVAQRTKFSYSVAFAGAVLATVIKPLWDRFASQMSGYNDFIRTNIDLFAAAMPDVAANLIISKGKMSLTSIATATVEADDVTLTVTWVDDSGEGFKLATDIAYFVAVNETKETILGFETAATRADATVGIVLAEIAEAGNTVNVYMAFKRADGTVVSNTSFKVATVNP